MPSYPWLVLSHWEPFRVDALGLITLLGAEDVDTWVGRLVPSRWMEYMPLLAMYVIAGDRFRRKTPSFLLYNITKGIHTTDCAAWFTRWIQCQNFETTRCIVYWEARETPRSQTVDHLCAAGVSLCFTGLLLVMTVLSRDMYGVANAVAIIVSILARAHILRENRTTIDNSIPGFEPGLEADKLIVITPDSTVITMFVPGAAIVPAFIQNPEPNRLFLYKVVRWINWLAFGVHVITLGMASLATQIYTVGLVLASSILICLGFGCADMARARGVKIDLGDTSAYTCWIGSHLKATVFEWPSHFEFCKEASGAWKFRDENNPCHPDKRTKRRIDLYAWLDLSQEEEDSLAKWDLLPHRRGNNTNWDDEFRAKKALVRARGADLWDVKQTVAQGLRMERAKSSLGTFNEKSLSSAAWKGLPLPLYHTPETSRFDGFKKWLRGGQARPGVRLNTLKPGQGITKPDPGPPLMAPLRNKTATSQVGTCTESSTPGSATN
ncbi:hypothetical protein BJY01DRAFT_186434 [Aspergillus pseudoustus]|uniref:Uncharacterized protein n=1 Tax=Aspergillus pseudoustus TaxID=1810923 RepID=A0ABR4JX07_9EURO